jgi:opacity protein-like surface antigen
MLCLCRVGVAGVVAVSVIASAQAADMPGLPPPVTASPPAALLPVWMNSGWYIRGDLGWRSGLIGAVHSAPGFPDPTDNQLGNGFTAGGGVGIKTGIIRTDFTIDYASPLKYTGSVVAPDDTSAKIQSINFLFNGYLDLGTWYRLTPYIGAGAGTALVGLTDYHSTGAPPFAGNANHSQWNFAWAGMAGVAWAIAPYLMVDFGYRYLNVGSARTSSSALGAMKFDNVAGHEVHVGLRWSFDDLREYR